MRLLSRRPDPTRYVMLMCSLPYHGALFAAKQTPLSRLHLDKRLTLMTPADRERLRRIERVIQWDAMEGHLSDPEMVRRANTLLDWLRAEDGGTLYRAVRNRLELRTVVAALRRRHMGYDAPSPDDPAWGIGRWTARIAANWEVRDFGLHAVFHWIGEAQDLLEADDPHGLEKLLLGAAWRDLGRQGQGHEFDFTAVAVYVLRWHIIDRWTRMDAAAAVKRFDALLSDGLGAHATLFEGEGADA
jgi:hypothetical protein